MGAGTGWRYPKLFSAEESILLKPNLLRKSAPESAVVTHPAVVSAAAELLLEAGFRKLSYGDSVGVGSVEKIAEGCGLAEEMKKEIFPWRILVNAGLLIIRKEKWQKRFHMAKAVEEADALLNLCKMKTHQLERMTGAVKNMYGCIQGLHKAKGHTKYSNAESFARMLVDLNQCIRPRLYIMDGITAMEGNGPASGRPVDMGGIAGISGSGCSGQCLLRPDALKTGPGADKCPGSEDGSGGLEGK